MRMRVSPYRRSSWRGRVRPSGARLSLSATATAPGASTAGRGSDSAGARRSASRYGGGGGGVRGGGRRGGGEPVRRVEEDQIVLGAVLACRGEEAQGIGAAHVGGG